MHRWGDTVLRLALSQLRDASDAEDVFQDVFVRLLKDRTAFNDDEHLKAWLLRVTINRCRDIGRSGWKRRNEPLAERHAALAVEAPDLLESDIWNAIGTLPPDLRAVVHLHYVEGYSTDEAAALVGCRPSTARTRLHRARKHLKAALETADLAGRPAPCQPAGASRADDGSAFSRPASSAFASTPTRGQSAAPPYTPQPPIPRLPERRPTMSHDPFDDYAAKIQEVRTSDRLRDEVLKKAAAERQAASATGKVPAGSGAACNEARKCAGAAASSHGEPARKPSARPRAKRPAIRGLALAACLAALAAIVGFSLAWPQGSGSLPAGISPTAFAVKAYGAVDDTSFSHRFERHHRLQLRDGDAAHDTARRRRVCQRGLLHRLRVQRGGRQHRPRPGERVARRVVPGDEQGMVARERPGVRKGSQQLETL